MRITIHRGTEQIGGCVTEYEHKGWRLFVDYGEQLPGTVKSHKPLEIEGLTKGDLSKSALLITHYHSDHIGRIGDLSAELPIYIGKIARDIQEYVSEHKRFVDPEGLAVAERLKCANTFVPGEAFKFGLFTIMPVTIDHSAFDAYAFKIEADGVSAFHTGDFRTYGFRSSKLPVVIEKYVGKVDYMVCEATNASRPDATAETEHDLQKRFEQTFRDNKYNIVYLSSTNIDRLFALYHAALKTGRPFYVDGYQRHIMDIVTQRDTMWGKSVLYRYGKYEPKTLQRDGDEFRIIPEFEMFLENQGYVLIARASKRFDDLIAKMPGEPKKRYLSSWSGCLNPENEAYDPTLAFSLREGYEPMHTSGHCDMTSLESLVEMLSPKAVIPIHTDNAEDFAKHLSDRWPVILLKDGESINPIGGQYTDGTYAEIIAVNKPTDEYNVIANGGGCKWWSLDNRHVGYFGKWNDATNMLQAISYAPKRLLGYNIEDEEDMSPFSVAVYDHNFNQITEYEWESHAPGEGNFQEMGWLTPGDKVLAVIRDFDAVIPCEIIGPISEEFLKAEKEADEMCPFAYEEIKEDMWDWDWDKVIVRPLVRLADEHKSMPEQMLAQRVDIFPYREFDL